VTGDLAGFLAATWHRGVPVYQVPTSLLAMVDASVGGKTGVDLAGGKNLVGAFHQPAGLAVDPSLLRTLPDPELRHGLAEAVKLAAVADAALFARLERDADALLAREAVALLEIVTRCIAGKHRIVARDEREAGPRAALNFGHTVGHALERLSGYAIPHGQAVAIGCAVEAAIAVEAAGFPSATAPAWSRCSRASGSHALAGGGPDLRCAPGDAGGQEGAGREGPLRASRPPGTDARGGGHPRGGGRPGATGPGSGGAH
jgi:3-dehydroquinate synthase